MKKQLLLFGLICLVINLLPAQEQADIERGMEAQMKQLDSLKALLHKEPTLRKERLIALMKGFELVSQDSAVAYNQKLVELLELEGEDPAELVKWRNYLTHFKIKMKRFDGVPAILEKSLAISEQLGNKTLVDVYDLYTGYYVNMGDCANAIQYIKKSQEIISTFEDSTYFVNIGKSYYYLANCYYAQSDLEKAIEYYEDAASYFLLPDMEVNKIAAYMNIGVLYSKLIKKNEDPPEKMKEYYDDGLKWITAAEKLIYEYKTFYLAPNLYRNFGILNYNFGNYDQSLRDCYKGLSIAKEHDFLTNNEIRSIEKYIGLNYYAKEEYRDAIKHFKIAFDNAPNPFLQYEIEVYPEYINAFQQIGNYKSAFTLQEAFLAIKDSLNEVEYREHLVAVTEEFESEKKTKEIEILNIENKSQAERISRQYTIIFSILILSVLLLGIFYLFYKNAKTKQALDRSKLQQRLLRTQLNPHFLFHSLTSIQSFVLKNEKEKSVNFLQSFSKLMRSILETSDIDFVPLEEEIVFIKNYLKLQRLNHDFDFEVIVNSSIQTDKVLIPPMLSQPYIENAVLHGAAQVESGMVQVRYFLEKDRLKLEITDNGGGLSTNEKSANQLYRSMSTKIINERIENIQASHKVNIRVALSDLTSATSNKGLVVTFTFPLLYQ